MSLNLNRTLLTTILVPCLWGSTYIVFTQTLPVDHPLLVGALRALPAGLLLMALGPGLPPRDKLLPLSALGLANIGIFFALLFVSAARLPGGLAATVGSTQPLIVGLLAWPLLGRRPGRGQILAALAGLIGVALLVLDPQAKLDAVGIVAGLASAASMATGTVLIERWGKMGSPLALAAWQLTLGGLILLPVALLVEGLPPTPTILNGIGLGYLVLVGTALAYWLWVRGITTLGASVAFLGLLSPTVATILGAVLLGQWLGGVQLLGIAVILGSTITGMLLSRRAAAAAARPQPRSA
ncbi:EamA family transporter [Bosea sp. SSUT16]|jgi:probable blue pigment (indigoidine) exporter|uniref:EamA family transporter n=1 Tax=Bosea spartocytisi TaxID=2773451 RepID=A0A927E7T2_9HYPH|nr:EamA family transporter [Bosea spartocytisi]MBD3845807.1 EamA family transporter [Bosea spartocytisi]MCT4473100.1 DMT family transporter [Bosea spartocytisi]